MENKQTAAQFVNESRRARDKMLRAREMATGDTGAIAGGIGSDVISWLTKTSELVPDWWSRNRDITLSSVWKENPHLSLALYNTQAKLVGIPFTIKPRNPSNQTHWDEAREIQLTLEVTGDLGKGWGWSSAYSRFVEDLITTDNGAFFEIIGDGRPDGPIVGRPITIRHLDSLRVKRTGDAEFPILYQASDGKNYKIHWTRLIEMSQMPSARTNMHGVGFCAVSRSIEIAVTLTDMVRYKQERLGSRPANQLLVGKGVAAQTIMEALSRVDAELSNRGFSRYSKTVAVGSENPDIGIDRVELNHTAPFDEAVSTNLGMYAIAAALGMDADEIWPSSGRSGGGSSGDANLRRIRARGRLPQQLTQALSTQFNFKFLPPYLMMDFDFKDDEQDQQEALIKDIRGRNRERDISTGTINIRTARVQMLEKGDVDQTTFDMMELEGGRMPNGEPLSMLFFDTTDPIYSTYLQFMDDPLLITQNTRQPVTAFNQFTGVEEDTTIVDDVKVDTILNDIEAQRQLVLEASSTTNSHEISFKLLQSGAALNWLQEQYNFAAGRVLPEVPLSQRRMRTDIRVAPEEPTALPQDGVSPAQQGGTRNQDQDG